MMHPPTSRLATRDYGTEMAVEASELTEGVSINDLRKNLALLNQFMEEQLLESNAAVDLLPEGASFIAQLGPQPG